MTRVYGKCKYKDCDRIHSAKGYCVKHYYYAQRHGLLKRPACKLEDCTAPSFVNGYCNKHNLRYKRHGDPYFRKKAANGETASKVCCVHGCEKNCQVSDYCGLHYHRINKYGDPFVKVTKANGEATKESQRLLIRKAYQRYSKTPYGRVRKRYSDAKRRILKFGGSPEAISRKGFIELWRQDDCGICGEYIDEKDKTIDHIIPLSRGGTILLDNMQVAHLKCNLRKSNKVFILEAGEEDISSAS